MGSGRGLKIRNNDLELALGNIAKQTVFEKFGRNPDIDASPAEDIWNGGGDYTGFPTEVETMEIASSDAADASAGTGARTVKIINLLDSTGAISPDVTVTLNGTTQVSLGALTYSRASRMEVLTTGSGGENAGTLTLRHTSITTNIFAVMPTGANRTAICTYTVPVGYRLFVNYLSARLGRANGSPGSASMTFRAREHGGAFQAITYPEITDSTPYIKDGGFYFEFPARTDIKWRCESASDANNIVSAEFAGILLAD